VFFNCEEERKTTFSEINITTDNNNLVEVNIPEASGNEAIMNQINSEIQKKVISALHIGNLEDTYSSSIQESIISFINEYNTFKKDFPESSQLWEAQIDGEVIYQSEEFTTVAITSYKNTGGAHGNLNISFLNFDLKTGLKLDNIQLFTDIESFKTIAETYFESETKDKNLLSDDKTFKLPENIGYSEDGIILLYNTYEVASYSTGIIEFAIPFSKCASYLAFNSL
jgi:hypothetical protein